MLDNYYALPKKLVYPPANCKITERLKDRLLYGLPVLFDDSVEWLYYYEEGGAKIVVDYRITKG